MTDSTGRCGQTMPGVISPNVLGPCILLAGHDGQHRAADGSQWLLFDPTDWKTVARAEQQRAEQAEATVARAWNFAEEMRTWCSPYGVAVDYADRLQEVLGQPPTDLRRQIAQQLLPEMQAIWDDAVRASAHYGNTYAVDAVGKCMDLVRTLHPSTPKEESDG